MQAEPWRLVLKHQPFDLISDANELNAQALSPEIQNRRRELISVLVDLEVIDPILAQEIESRPRTSEPLGSSFRARNLIQTNNFIWLPEHFSSCFVDFLNFRVTECATLEEILDRRYTVANCHADVFRRCIPRKSKIRLVKPISWLATNRPLGAISSGIRCIFLSIRLSQARRLPIHPCPCSWCASVTQELGVDSHSTNFENEKKYLPFRDLLELAPVGFFGSEAAGDCHPISGSNVIVSEMDAGGFLSSPKNKKGKLPTSRSNATSLTPIVFYSFCLDRAVLLEETQHCAR